MSTKFSAQPTSKVSTFHRRQSALNLPIHSTQDFTTSGGIQSTQSLSNEPEEVTVSQGEPSLKSERHEDILEKPSRSFSFKLPLSLETSPEKCDKPTSSSRGQQMFDSRRSRRGSVSHLRTLSRDFVLHSLPTSSVRHENLTSLKDQFLKIKERFSPSVLPLPTTLVAPVASAESDKMSTTDLTGPMSSDQMLCESFDRDANSNWKFPQARVKRWYREDDYYKTCITCWTMEAGAAIVSKFAGVISEWAANTSSNHSLSACDSCNLINPDVSLQWIGRQWWAVTVSLPLSHLGELHAEHICLEHQINKAVADVYKSTDARLLTSPFPLTRITANQGSLNENVDTESKPVPLALNSIDASPFSTLAPEDVDILRLRQAQMAGNEEVEGSFARRDHEEFCGQWHNDYEEEQETGSEQASALPLSWSMLSLSSQPSGSSEHASLQGENVVGDDESNAEVDVHLVPEKIGWLKKKKRKQHGLGSPWQLRYFELKGNRLYYFANEADGLPRGAVLLDHALVQRGCGEHSMAFSISSASSHRRLEVLKFSASLTYQVLPRKSIELRVIDETDVTVSTWIAALNRASFYCVMASSVFASSTLPARCSASSRHTPNLSTKRKTSFYRFRHPSVAKTPFPSSSLSYSVKGERLDVRNTDKEVMTTAVRWSASYQQLGSVQYLRDTDPLLWEIHPPEQIAIRKKAARARTRSEYLAIFARHAETFSQIFLPRPQPISLEQTLRDILPELFLINDTLYGGGEQVQQQTVELSDHGATGQQQNRGLEHIFEVLDAHIQRFAAAPEERVRGVSALLQACARTISGGDSYFVVHRLLGNPNLIIRPAEARGRPIEIDVSTDRPSRFLITVFSAFSFHLLDDVERFGDINDAHGAGMTPAPLLRVRTRHIQEFDFAGGTSTRWLKIDIEGRKEDASPCGSRGGNGTMGRWGSRRQSYEGAESRIGALLDALS